MCKADIQSIWLEVTWWLYEINRYEKGDSYRAMKWQPNLPNPCPLLHLPDNPHSWFMSKISKESLYCCQLEECMKLRWNHIHHSSMPGTAKEELGICGFGQDCIGRTAKRYLKIPLIIAFCNKPRAISSESRLNLRQTFQERRQKGLWD